MFQQIINHILCFPQTLSKKLSKTNSPVIKSFNKDFWLTVYHDNGDVTRHYREYQISLLKNGKATYKLVDCSYPKYLPFTYFKYARSNDKDMHDVISTWNKEVDMKNKDKNKNFKTEQPI